MTPLVVDLVERLPRNNTQGRVMLLKKTIADTGDDHSLERRLCLNADVGRPSVDRQKEVNREYVLVATHRFVYNNPYIPN
jgi:hypothetical protein